MTRLRSRLPEPQSPGIGPLMPMAMAGLIWLCLLVVILIVVPPLFGGWAALVGALVSLAVITLICFAICGLWLLPSTRVRQDPGGAGHRVSREFKAEE